jgi:ssDNA-binding replication factor A large subunit
MIKAAYEQIVEKIAKQSGLSEDDVKRRIEAKRARLSGLISKEGAAQIVAAELGISFDKQKVKISELLDGMRKISVVAKVIEVYPVRTYTRKGVENKVATMMVADDTASVRVVLWDTHHISMIEKGEITKDVVVEIKNASVRAGELHLGSLSDIRLSSEKIDSVKVKELLQEKNLSDLQLNDKVIIRATVLQVFEPRFFSICPECFLKVRQEENRSLCDKHGAVIPKFRAIMTLIVDDGSSSIRAVFFSDNLIKLLNIDEEEIDKLRNMDYFLQIKNDLLGKEFWFSGRVRQNRMFGNLEFVVSDVYEVNPDELIEKLNK